MATGRSRAFEVKIVGDVKDAQRSLKSMEKKVNGFSKAMKGIAGAMVAAFAVQKVTQFVSDSVKRAEEMQSAYAATAQIIEQTGGAAGLTADEIKTMNRELSMATGVDKAAITDSTNILLTFKNIAGDTFRETNELALDMAAVMKTDAKSAALQLGKALNDPIKGITALSRAGVQFTDEQKEMIATLQESGDMLGAQEIILAEVESQFGGVAEATADSTAKIGNARKEVQEGLGNALLPIIDKVATFVVDKMLPAFETMGAWLKKNVPPWWEKYIAPVLENIMEGVRIVWEWISKFWKKHGDGILATVKEWAGLIWGYYSALFELYKKVAETVLAAVAVIWERYGEQIMEVVRRWWDTISTIIGFVTDVLKGLIKFLTAVFKGDWEGAWDAILEIGQSVLDFFAEFPGKLVGYLASAVKLVGSAAMDLGRAIINGIIGFWNRLDPRITIGPMPSWIPGIGGKQWQSPDLFPDIPKLAAGGIVTGPTVALIGESGPEAIIPLGRSSGMGGGVTINVYAGVGDPVSIGEAITDAITAFETTNGTSWRDDSAIGAA